MWKSSRYMRESDVYSIEWKYMEINQAGSVGMTSLRAFNALCICIFKYKFMLINKYVIFFC